MVVYRRLGTEDFDDASARETADSRAASKESAPVEITDIGTMLLSSPVA